MKQKRISDYGINIGEFPKGRLNKITDVKGVRVGHSTLRTAQYNTGVTVILPTEGNIFYEKFVAASFVHNGFGKTVGTVQIDELGILESPIALTNTLNVGKIADALVGYMAERCEKEGRPIASINPVVGECNDSKINKITDRPLDEKSFGEALENATEDFAEGSVGAGTGTQCYGMKGGIGSASRVVSICGKDYTLGILVQSNYGRTADLILDGKPIGKELDKKVNGTECDQGSIMVIVATDAPLTARQLKRVIRRCSVGIARCGSYIGHGSGEVFIGFSTANIIPANPDGILNISSIPENKIDLLFRVCGEATEEAILNSMVTAETVKAGNGVVVRSLAEFI